MDFKSIVVDSVKGGRTSRPAAYIRSLPCGTGSIRISGVVVSYSDAFKRQLKRLSRRYRRIRDDIQPIIDRLDTGETPGDRIAGLGHILTRCASEILPRRGGKAAATESSIICRRLPTCCWWRFTRNPSNPTSTPVSCYGSSATTADRHPADQRGGIRYAFPPYGLDRLRARTARCVDALRSRRWPQ